MTEEIKEILDDLKKYANEGGEHKLMEYEIKHIHCYITNLQQKDFESQKEITKLKDKLEQQRKEYQDTYKDVRIEIKEKNERITNLQQAIEIKNQRIKEEQQEKERYIKSYNGLNTWNKELQQENEKLKEENILLKASEPMSKIAEDYGYKSRCEKANKKLKEIRQSTFIKYNSNEWDNCLSYNDDIKPLENILNGSDEK